MARYSTLLFFAFVAVFFYGCRKFDFKFRDPAKHCQIKMMTGLMSDDTIHRKFTYDEFGNPTLVEYVETENGTGTPTFYFYYNDKHQLIRYEGYGVHDFTYNSIGQIIIDSSREYYTGGDARYETKFYYDLYGRITRVVRKYYYDFYDNEDVGQITGGLLTYDHRGNLVRPDVTYDNKTSIFRTHPIWMFLNLNYSINNPVPATSYNSSGLPITFGDTYLNFLESAIHVRSVDYDCDEEVR